MSLTKIGYAGRRRTEGERQPVRALSVLVQGYLGAAGCGPHAHHRPDQS